MRLQPTTKNLIIFTCFIFLGITTSFSQVKNDFDVRYEADIRGELTFIGNNIVNRETSTVTRLRWIFRNGRWQIIRITFPGASPNDPYNNTGSASNNNDNFNMQYIDIDGDNDTFSSSSATLTVPDVDCSLVRYAGLYWSAVYVNPDRSNINQIKFRVPGGAYQDITADEELFDGDGDVDFGSYSPYAYYKDVTSIVAGLANPNGDYFVADMRVSLGGGISGGISGGWTMVIVYENPNLPGSKYITTFDGYAGIASGQTVDIPINGFTTLPAPFNVNAKIGVAALEGDNRITGDGLSISVEGQPFSPLGNAVNPNNNFFNSNITIDGNIINTRNPNSINTLGWDVDLFEVTNNFNNVIPNDATNAILRASSSQDKYDIFFASFDVEIIAPNIILEKKVNTPGGVDITGLGVNLGQILDYVLSFQNIGNDNATGPGPGPTPQLGSQYTIRDVLPVNVSFSDVAANLTLPPGVTYDYDAPSRTISFYIPDNLIQEGDPEYSIRFRVQVAENCFDFVNACSDLIENTAFSTYRGVENSALITDDPSVSDFDACGFVVPGATNFLLDDLADCNFSRSVELCGSEALLDAGDNFDSYVWVRDDNGNGLIDATDTVLNDGDPDNDPSTQLVTAVGTYIVDKIVADPCKGFKEIITVLPFGSGTIPHPIIEYFNTVNADADASNDIAGEIVQCSIDNDLLPKLFLCGINDVKPLQVNILDAQSLVWEVLDSCPTPDTSGDNCANKALNCSWNQVGTGNNYTVSAAGKYRLFVTYQNGCTSIFHFNAFLNTLDFTPVTRDILCTTPGNITITGLGTSYGYQLIEIDEITNANTISIPFSANNGPSFDFTTGENGTYRVEATQLDTSGIPIVGGCIFRTSEIGILERDVQYNINPSPETCVTPGSIQIQVSNADANYEYELRLDDGSNGGLGSFIDNETAQPDNNFTFTGLTAGNYIAIARTDDGCFHSEQVTIVDNNDLDLTASVTQPILCGNGIIEMVPSGGDPNYSYAIWTYVDESGTTVSSYPTPQDIPSAEYQSNIEFNILVPGDYTFVVVDDNNCFHFSNTVSISEFSVAYTTNSTDETCFEREDGSYTVNVTNSNGYTLAYALTYPDASVVNNNSGVFNNLPQGDYSIDIVQTSGTVFCNTTETFTINGPVDSVTADAVLTIPYTCLVNATIQAQNVTGGTAPYEYSIDGVNFVSGAGADTFTGLTDGIYNITIRDANGCTFTTTVPVVIPPLDPPTDISFTATAPNCPALTSDLTATVSNGNAPFVFEIIAPSTIAASSITGGVGVFNGLAPDTYTVRVTDDRGCFYEENYTIGPVTPIQVVGQLVSNTTCFIDADGEALFTVSGIGTNYNYSVTGPATFSGTAETNTTIPLTNLAVGTYDITVTDTTTNCTDTASVTIQAPPSALSLNQSETQPTCVADGNVTLTANGGWGGYNYELTYPDSNIVSNTTGVFTSLSLTGMYTTLVTDANGCRVASSFILNAAQAPVLSIAPNSSCYDAAIGLTLTSNITSGGDGNYQYRINGGAYSTNAVFTGLTAGTYTIDVIDGNNCTDSENITILPELSVTAIAPNISACTTTTNVTITAAGGDGLYVYSIVPDGSPAGVFNSTNPVNITTGVGDYDVYVRDNNGGTGFCEASFDLSIAQDAPIVITPTVTDILCNGDLVGAIALAVAGGNAPYEYQLEDTVPSIITAYQTTTSFSNLAAGDYIVRVRDASNCDITLPVTITQPNPITADAVQTENYTCMQSGEITVGGTTLAGGSGDYQFSLNGGAWTASTTIAHTFTGLIDGAYSINVRDANAISCDITLVDLIIAPLPIAPTLTSSVVYNCDGTGNITVLPSDPSYTYAINSGTAQSGNVFSTIAVGTHTITVDYGNGCTIDTIVTVDPGNNIQATITSFESLDCNADNSGTITFEVENFGAGGFEYSFDNFTTTLGSSTSTAPVVLNTLAAGSYTITVRDLSNPIAGCTLTLNQTITEPAILTATSSVTSPDTCISDATIEATVTGGTPIYEYQLEDTSATPVVLVAYQTSASFSGRPAGDYVIRVRDANNCETTTAITVVASINPTFVAAPTLCYSGNSDGSITVVASGGNGNYQFSINGGVFLSPDPVTASTYTFQNLTDGTYAIDIRDSFGCPAGSQDITINPSFTVTTVLSQDLSCLAPATVVINAGGGTGTYTYEWSDDSGANYQSTNFVGNVFTTTDPGSYLFRVTNTSVAGICDLVTAPVTISSIPQPVITSVTPTNVLCNGDVTGALDIVIDTTVGSPPYTIEVIETTGPNNYGAQTTGLPAGAYEVRITDDKGCVSDPFSATITEPGTITPNITSTNLTCTASTTVLGTITVDASGGTADYIYSVYNSDFSVSQTYNTASNPNSNTFTGLNFGDYTVSVTDANNCETLSTVTIATGPDVLLTTVGASGCAIGSGEMLVQAQASNGTLGTGSFFFAIYPAPAFSVIDPAWFPVDPLPAPINSHLFIGLTPGVTYTFVVHDTDTNCEYVQQATVPVSTTSTLVPVIDATTNVSCFGFADGSVDFTISGYGGANVSYVVFASDSNISTGITGSISGAIGGPETDSVSGLSPGDFYILYTEVDGPNAGCVIASNNFTIQQAPTLLSVTAASLINDTCEPNAGVITALAQFGAAPYEFQYLFSTATAPTATDAGWVTNTTANVESGNYIVYVKDANDCIQSDAVTVNLDPTPDISLSIVDECVGEGTFEVLVDLVSVGIAPYQLSLNGGAFQNIVFNGSNQYTITNVSSGLGQTVEVRDLNGCSNSEVFNIQPPLQYTAIQTALLDCDPGTLANAEITITVSSGSGNYEIEIIGPGAVDLTRTALLSNPFVWTGASAAGSYNISVYDMGTAPPNCVQTVVVDVPIALVPDFTQVSSDATCNGGTDGTITITEVGNGILPITYTLTPMPVGAILNGLIFENLPAGTYDLRGLGNNGCPTDIIGIVVGEPNTITVPPLNVVEFMCVAGNNQNNATITINIGGIIGGSNNFVRYAFFNDLDLVNPVQEGTNNVYTETNILGGNYTINVYDDNGCVGTTTTTIAPFDELLPATVTVDNPSSCTNGGEDVTINAFGSLTDSSTPTGLANYEFRLLPGAFGTLNQFNDLAIGTHTFEVRNINTNCMVSIPHTVIDPNTFEIATTTIDVVCYGTTTGEVSITLTDIVGGYTGSYTWSIFDTQGTPADPLDDGVAVATGTSALLTQNLATSEYRLSVVQDAFPDCTNETFFNIAGPSEAITATTEVTPVSCLGNDGAINIINAQGGWGNYTYFVDLETNAAPTDSSGFLNTSLFSGLSGGAGTDYQVWIADMNGCMEQLTDVRLTDPASIVGSLQINQENCTNLQGEIEVVGVGGGQGGNYTYQLIKDGTDFGAPQNTRVFSGLGAGSYEVRITDQLSCLSVIGTEVLYEEMILTSTVIQSIDCSGVDGEITISVAGGSSNLRFDVTYPLSAPLTVDDTNTTGIFTGLIQGGTYSFRVVDLDTTNPSSCEKTITQALDTPTPVTFDTPTISHVSCFGLSDGSITANLVVTTVGVNDNPIYSYNLYDAAGTGLITGPQTNPTFSGLAAATYQVEAVSGRGCSERQTITITQPTALAINASVSAFVCSPANAVNIAVVTVAVMDGATTPDISSGTGPYLYSLDNVNFQTTNTFDIIDTGSVQNLTVYVTDGNGCPTTSPVVVQPINTFTVDIVQNTPITCPAAEEILITVNDNGNATNAYTYELLPIGNPNGSITGTPTIITATFNLTAVGNYTFRITDTTTGCFVDEPYGILPYDLIEVTATATDPVICFGDLSGALRIMVNGYSGAYDYQVFDSANNPIGGPVSTDTSINPRPITGLSGGNYYVRVTEIDLSSSRCFDDTNTITIISPDLPLDASIGEVANVTCTNDQGGILVDPSGGFVPYDIVLTNTTTSQVYTANDVNAFVFGDLSEGNYTIAITDNNGCVINRTTPLIAPLPIIANATPLTTTLTCFGDTDGIVSAIITSGGSGTYQYLLNHYDPTGSTITLTAGPQSSPDFNNLGEGIYSITISDGLNCDIETNQVVISEPIEVFAFLVRTSPLTCATQAELLLTAGGGTAPYEYSADGTNYFPMSGGDTHTFNVDAGTYQYFVRDSFNCGSIVSNQITEDPVLPVNLILDTIAAIINCNGESNAIIYTDADGGMGNYIYELFTDASLSVSSRIAGPQSQGEFTGLPTGNYYVAVTSGDCPVDSEHVFIDQPTLLEVVDTNEFTSVTCFGANDGTITVELQGGSGGYIYAISPNLSQFDTENTFDELAPGDYTVIAQDQNGCFLELLYTITEPAILEVSATSMPEICVGDEDGAIDLAILGGTAPYGTRFSDETSFVQDRISIPNLQAGAYIIFIRDANGCETNVSIVVDPGANLNAIIEPVYECTGDTPDNFVNITLEDPSVIGDVLYALDSTDPADMQLNPDFRNSTPGTHYIAIAHSNGCVRTFDFEIENFEPLVLTLEQNNLNEITAVATGGRENYTFYFEDVNNGEDNTFHINRTDTYVVRVVDENGCESMANIFIEFIDIEIPNFFTPDGDGQNDFWAPRNMEAFPEIITIIFDRYGREVYRLSLNDPGWNGLYNETELPTGDYWYIIRLNGASDAREFVGNFTLYR